MKNHSRFDGFSVRAFSVLFSLSCGIFLLLPATATAAETRAAKTVEGEISGMGKSHISVMFQSDQALGEEQEILLPMDREKVRLQHKRSLDELKVGDKVRVIYEEITAEENGKETKKFNATSISFVRAGGPRGRYSVVDEETVLPLKGVK